MVIPHFRIERAVLFVDESGQMRPPRSGAPTERPILGALAIPDHPRHHAMLHAIVARVRERLDATSGPTAHFKKARHDVVALDWIAAAIRDHWCLGHPVVEVRDGEGPMFTEMIDALPPMIEAVRRRLGAAGRDLRLDWLLRDLRELQPSAHLYLGVLYHLFRECARWFRRNDILPRMSVLLDEKLRPKDGDALTFLLRFAVCDEFPEVYGHRPGVVLGIEPCADFDCRVTTDDAEDGIKIADIIAYARWRAISGADDDGVYAGFLGACSC